MRCDSNNDLNALNVNAIAIDDASSYWITGNAINLGSGGIAASALAAGPAAVPQIDAPITLSAPQTWSIDGGGFSSQHQISIGGEVSGSTQSLAVNFSNQAGLNLLDNSDVEVGAVTVAGVGSVALLGEESGSSHASLNGNDGNPVSISGGADLFSPSSGATTGPLAVTGGNLEIGQEGSSASTFAVNGSITFDSTSSLAMVIDHSGTTPGTDYSQLTASGPVNLANATLYLRGSPEPGVCPLKLGEVYTLVKTSGSLDGTLRSPYGSLPDGGTTPIYGCDSTVQINYTANAVTATTVASTSPPTVAKSAPQAKFPHHAQSGPSLDFRADASLTVKRGAVRVNLRCIGSGRCSGTATLTATARKYHRSPQNYRRSPKAKRPVIGRGHFSMAGGTSGSVTIHLTRAGIMMLHKAHGRVRAGLTLTGRASGRGVEETKTVELKAFATEQRAKVDAAAAGVPAYVPRTSGG